MKFKDIVGKNIVNALEIPSALILSDGNKTYSISNRQKEDIVISGIHQDDISSDIWGTITTCFHHKGTGVILEIEDEKVLLIRNANCIKNIGSDVVDILDAVFNN